MSSEIKGHRVDAHVDNMVVVQAWGSKGCKDIALARILKSIFTVITELNADLSIRYIPSAQNPADAPSRSISWGMPCWGKEPGGRWREPLALILWILWPWIQMQ